jgi:hypothetical protein
VAKLTYGIKYGGISKSMRNALHVRLILIKSYTWLHLLLIKPCLLSLPLIFYPLHPCKNTSPNAFIPSLQESQYINYNSSFDFGYVTKYNHELHLRSRFFKKKTQFKIWKLDLIWIWFLLSKIGMNYEPTFLTHQNNYMPNIGWHSTFYL